jgi:hypothetical protein
MNTVADKAIDIWLEQARGAGLLTGAGLSADRAAEAPAAGAVSALLYPASVREERGHVYALLKLGSGPALGIFGPGVPGFSGVSRRLGENQQALFCPLIHENALRLRSELPFTAPSPLASQRATIGLGDRLGVASPGHIRTVRERGAAPVLAQQSVRELDLTARSYADVLDAASWAVFQEGYERPWGADGDHLKTEEWVRTAIEVGYTMITADVSDYIRGEYMTRSREEVLAAYAELAPALRRALEAEYLNRPSALDTGEEIGFNEEELARVALVYGEAVNHAERLYRAGVEAAAAGGFDFELSVDETETPTTPRAHLFVAGECRRRRLGVTSLAPRFVGEFQKGIDYIGDPGEFEKSFAIHAAIARSFGYRISVHSGSDKFRVFPAVGRLTEGSFHIKTAGTSWLEAVRVIARLEPALYRRLHAAALDSFGRATGYYHVTTDLSRVPALDSLADSELPGLFDNPDARQLIHITYGELLRDPAMKHDFFSALEQHIEAYWQALQVHIGRHLDRLGI